MKIGIITFIDAVNYGAYLQAFSLGEYLKGKGNDVYYIRKRSLKMLYWQFHNLYAYHPNKIKFRNEFREKWKKSKQKFQITSDCAGYDLVIIGSDEMWQLNGETTKPLPEYWGVGIDAKKTITYAVCSNGTTAEKINEFPFIETGIKNLAGISVRDKATKALYEELTGKDISVNIDPTFLIDLRKYEVEPSVKKYILVYTYSFNEEKVKKVKEFAKKNNELVVCVGNKFDWCDCSIPASPFEALGLFDKADYVVTDTFHGTALAINFNKQFVSFAKGKEKVLCLLEEFALQNRCIDEDASMDRFFDETIDYSDVNRMIVDACNDSLEYLESFLTK